MYTRKKILILLACSSMMMVEEVFSKSTFYISGPFEIPFFSCDIDDIGYAYKYIRDTIYNHPIATASIGVTVALSLYLMQHYADKTMQKDGNESSESEKSFPKNFLKFQQCDAHWYFPGQTTITFKDVAGMHEAKAEVYDFVDFLKDSQQFLKMGVKIPKGVLLEGDPGTGKTLLARAVAGEASVPLCYLNASQLMEAYVGVGAARVRDLFKQARAQAPCIIFIDEIDSVGYSRSNSGGGSNEAVQTLNQLLAEMDGFAMNENPIIVMAATNRINVLDKALTRPGRFDRQVHVRKPELKDRIEILHIHMRNVPVSDDVDFVRLARATRGFSGAQLACLINNAAILAVRQRSQKVFMQHFEEAFDTMQLGRICNSSMNISDTELWQTAVHEAGHALLHVYQKDAMPVYKVSIQPRAGSLGVTRSLPEIERYNDNYQQLFAQMVSLLGGSVAEEIVCKNRGTGALSDLSKVRLLAVDIVAKYGMSDEFRNITFTMQEWQDLSPEIRDRLEIEIHKLIKKAESLAIDLLTQHRFELDALVAILLEKQVVNGDEVYELCGVDKPGIEFTLS